MCRASSVPSHNTGVPRRHSWSTRPGASPGRVQVIPVPSQGTTLGFQPNPLGQAAPQGPQHPTSSPPDQQPVSSTQPSHGMRPPQNNLPHPSGRGWQKGRNGVSGSHQSRGSPGSPQLVSTPPLHPGGLAGASSGSPGSPRMVGPAQLQPVRISSSQCAGEPAGQDSLFSTARCLQL